MGCKACCLLLACKLGCFMHISGIFLCFRRVSLEKARARVARSQLRDEPGPYVTLEVGSEHSERAAATLCEHAHQSSAGPIYMCNHEACCSSSFVPLIVHLLKCEAGAASVCRVQRFQEGRVGIRYLDDVCAFAGESSARGLSQFQLFRSSIHSSWHARAGASLSLLSS